MNESARRKKWGLSSSVFLVRADVTDSHPIAAAVGEVAKRFGRIDILVHLVGGWKGGEEVHAHGDETWQRMIDLNLTSAFDCCRAVLPGMRRQGWGRIVLVSDKTAAGRRRGQGAYAVAKAGVTVLAETIAEENRGLDVTANAIAPSTLDTPANRAAMPDADHSSWVPAEDVAATIEFLISDAAGQLRGGWLPVFGGV
jgi:NAD(P)-dependent dehydrogenase (short-subunit alcohol dehydrogenase family)